jgi:hypothetical protein
MTIKAQGARVMLASAIGVALMVPIAQNAEAHHRPNSYCSSTGDICQTTAKFNGIRKLKISLAAKYFSHYDLCVVTPDGTRTCHTYDIERQGDFFGDTVRWDTHFPDGGRGPYTVIWKMTSGDRVGRKLGFHV